MADDSTAHIKDMMNPPGYFEGSQRRKEYNIRDIPAFSGKLLQEFDKRRSIKDMFGRKPSLKTVESIPESPSPDPMPSTMMPFMSAALTPLPLEADNQDATVASIGSTPMLSQTPPVLSQTSQFTASPDKKRPVPSPAASPRTLKRSKSSTGTPAATNTASKGQSSLKGFFKPKLSAQSSVKEDSKFTAQPLHNSQASSMVPPLGASQSTPVVSALRRALSTATVPATDDALTIFAPSTTAPSTTTANDAPSPEAFVDPIVSKESWSKMFAKPVAPRCEHNEPCKTMQTKKKGFNCGREFWMCARPLGPSGAKEKNTQWRCSTFIWSSDWNGSGERNP